MLQLPFVLFELAWYAVFLFAVHHALSSGGPGKTVTFFLPATAFGFLLEWALQALYHGYRYGDGFLLYVANVPLSVCLTWATLLYLGIWTAREKWKIGPAWRAAVVAAVLLVLLDALHFEPMAQRFGFWVWRSPGPWFGAQMDNFFLWFWVAAVYLIGFQWVDGQKWAQGKKMAANLALVPFYFIALVGLMHGYGILVGAAH